MFFSTSNKAIWYKNYADRSETAVLKRTLGSGKQCVKENLVIEYLNSVTCVKQEVHVHVLIKLKRLFYDF